jgi:hypothetical protein
VLCALSVKLTLARDILYSRSCLSLQQTDTSDLSGRQFSFRLTKLFFFVNSKTLSRFQLCYGAAGGITTSLLLFNQIPFQVMGNLAYHTQKAKRFVFTSAGFLALVFFYALFFPASLSYCIPSPSMTPGQSTACFFSIMGNGHSWPTLEKPDSLRPRSPLGGHLLRGPCLFHLNLVRTDPSPELVPASSILPTSQALCLRFCLQRPFFVSSAIPISYAFGFEPPRPAPETPGS